MTHTNSTSHTQKPSGVTSCFKIPSKLLTKSMKVLVLLLCVYTNAHVCAGPDVCASTYAYVSVCMLRSKQSPAFSSGTMHPLGRSVNEPQRSACLCLPSSGLMSISTMPALFFLGFGNQTQSLMIQDKDFTSRPVSPALK